LRDRNDGGGGGVGGVGGGVVVVAAAVLQENCCVCNELSTSLHNGSWVPAAPLGCKGKKPV